MTEENKNNVFALTPKQTRIVDGAMAIWDAGEHAQNITYSHSTMCQTSLPFKASEDREWINRNGKSIVLVEAGQVFDPNENDMVKMGLPYGPKPRLILMDWNRQAVLTQSATIEVEDTLYAFMKRLGLPVTGNAYRMTKKQLSALAACHFTLGRINEDGEGGKTVYGRVVQSLDLLFHKDENQRLLWPNTITFSQEYFESLMSHSVPLNEDALHLLKDSALELDLYAMFSERLHRIPFGKPQFVPWAALYEQYGQGYKRIRAFRAKFLTALKNVAAVYPDAQIEEVKSNRGTPQGLRLFSSKPPVRKLLVQKPVD